MAGLLSDLALRTRAVCRIAHRCWLAPVVLLLTCWIGNFDLRAGEPEELAWAALREHGIVLYRHAHAPGGGDPRDMKLGDCATQRNLDEIGREEARRIGNKLRAKRIEVGRVAASQWCRTAETADLALPGRKEFEPAFNSFFDDRSRGPVQTEQARAILSGWRGPGALVVFTHHVNIQALTGLAVASGEGVVVKVVEGRIAVVGRIAP